VRRQNVTYVGPDVYSSVDVHDGRREFTLRTGEWTAVSEPKAEQLAADFPHWFEFGETIGTDDSSVALALAEQNAIERARLDREAQEARERDRLRQIEEDARMGEIVRLQEEAMAAEVSVAEAHATEAQAEDVRLEAEDVAAAVEAQAEVVEADLAEKTAAAPPRTRERAARRAPRRRS
jgi:hypothetical protein